MYIVRLKDDRYGRRWKVREAVSLRAAVTEIQHAMVFGSIGGKSTVVELDGVERRTRVLADVVQINSDGTERRAYTPSY